MSKNKEANTNCLKSKRCPKCKSVGPFKVEGHALFVLHDDGTEDGGGNIEFNGDSYAECAECGHHGIWEQFDRSEMEDLPNGTLILYKGHRYFMSRGLEGRIVTGEDGNWQFIKDLNWKKYKVLHQPKK
jgi:hypothetical protein